MYRRILFPLDGSHLAEQPIPYVRLLSKALHLPIELLLAFTPIPRDLTEDVSTDFTSEFGGAAAGGLEMSSPTPRGTDDPMHGRYLEQIEEGRQTHAKDYLEHVRQSLKDVEEPISAVVVEEAPASFIVEEAEKEPGTLVVMSTHGRSGLRRWTHGSVTDRVLHATTGPLLVVRAREESEFAEDQQLTHVVVPLDGSTLAEQALPHAVQLALELKMTISLVRVLPSPQGYMVGDGHYASVLPDYIDQEKQTALEYIREIRTSLHKQGIASVEGHVLEGHPAESILDFADKMANSMVVMMTHGRSGMGRWILGSVADHVIRHAGRPILVLRGEHEGQ